MLKKSICIMLILCMCVVSLVACGKKGEVNNSETVANEAVDKEVSEEVAEVVDDYVINVGYYNCDHMVAAPIMEAAGIFEKLGLNVVLTGNGKVPEAMAAGQMDAGYIGSRRVVAASGEGAPVVFAANNHSGGSEYLVVANDIEKPEDIYNQPVAIGDPSKDVDWLSSYSQTLNLSTDAKDYELVNVGSDADKFLALSIGQIKAYTTCDPWGSMAEHEGVGKIMATYHDRDGKTGICCAFALNKNFIKEHRELAKKLMNAHTEGVKFIYENPKAAAEIFAKYYKVPYEVSLKTIYKKCIEEGRTLTWKLNDEEYNHMFDIYEKYKLIDNLPDRDEIVDRELYQEAELDDFDKFIAEKVDANFPTGMSFEDFEKKANELYK